jgi:hypothetical protein
MNMSNTKQMSDKQAFEQLIRGGQRTNRVSWRPSSSPDPADQRADRDALNQAIRRAASRGEQEEDAEPFPWTSLKDGGREDGS